MAEIWTPACKSVTKGAILTGFVCIQYLIFVTTIVLSTSWPAFADDISFEVCEAYALADTLNLDRIMMDPAQITAWTRDDPALQVSYADLEAARAKTEAAYAEKQAAEAEALASLGDSVATEDEKDAAFAKVNATDTDWRSAAIELQSIRSKFRKALRAKIEAAQADAYWNAYLSSGGPRSENSSIQRQLIENQRNLCRLRFGI